VALGGVLLGFACDSLVSFPESPSPTVDPHPRYATLNQIHARVALTVNPFLFGHMHQCRGGAPGTVELSPVRCATLYRCLCRLSVHCPLSSSAVPPPRQAAVAMHAAPAASARTPVPGPRLSTSS
jgi:hypothetical protein